MPRDLVDYFVLDSLADDIESLEQIIPWVTHSAEIWQTEEETKSFRREAVVASLLRLIRDRSVEALTYTSSGKELADMGEGVIPQGNFDDYWFRLTPRGRMLHDAWEPPPERLSK
jgi:hypothetical protein